VTDPEDERRPVRRLVGSCADCFGWGLLAPRGRCRACYVFARAHEQGRCQSCGRFLAVKVGHCRLCWAEAGRQANLDLRTNGTGVPNSGPLAPFLRDVRTQQLSFTEMAMALSRSAPASARRRTLEPEEPFQPPIGPGQLRLFEAQRDLTRVRRRPTRRRGWLEAALAVPHVGTAWAAAQRSADTLGWPPGVLSAVRGTLLAALCCRPADEPVRYSELVPLAAKDLSVERAAEVLASVGMLDDDRPGTLDKAFQRHLKDVAPAIRADVQDWLMQLIEGTNRTRPRSRATAAEYLRVAAPLLTAWSRDHEHLREITTSQVSQSLTALPGGSPRVQALIALRSLFRYLRGKRRVFRNPTARLRPGPARTAVLIPLEDTNYQRAAGAAATPEHRLALILAAVLAVRPAGIAGLELDDIDLGGRRVTVSGQQRHLDDFAYKVISDYLDYRRSRWPGTANPHVLVSQQTAHDTRPVTSYYLSRLFKGHGISLDRMRTDRWLEEALSRGPDPLHLAAVLGISSNTAMRYARAARLILESDRSCH
jgi:integrase